MRLKKHKNVQNNITKTVQNTPTIHQYNKNINLEKSYKTLQNESIYLNKILKQNLGTKKADSNFPNFKENIKNFHSNIQNILSNEESREKAMKYVINMRNKRIKLSPLEIRNKKSRNLLNVNNSNNKNQYSRTINDGFYEAKNRKHNISDNLDFQEINDNDNDNNYRNKKIYYEKTINNDLSSRKNKELNNQYNSTNRIYLLQNRGKVIKVNKKNQYYNEIPNKSRDENIYIRNKLNTSLNLNEFSNNFNNINQYKNTFNYPKTNRQYYYSKNYDNIYSKLGFLFKLFLLFLGL